MTTTTCPQCHRPIERDDLNGKPANAVGYCVGTDTCRQHGREAGEHPLISDRNVGREGAEINERGEHDSQSVLRVAMGGAA